ncbi:60S ribosomal subunit assembly or modification protein, partial [Coemansia sp. S155-1]
MNSDDRHNHYDEEDDVEETFVDDDDVADVVHYEGEEGDMAMDDEDDEEEGEGGERSEILLEDDSVQGFFAHKEPVFSIDLHPTQQNLVVSGGSDDRAYIWQLDTGEQIA